MNNTPKTYLLESILSTIFCCFPTGILGIINASKVEKLYKDGLYREAEQASLKAKKLFKLSIIIGIICYVIMLIFLIYSLNNQATFINTSADQIAVVARGGKYSVEIESDGKWDVDYSSSWMTIDKRKEKIIITFKKNETGDHRYGWITLSSGSLNKKIEVLQSGYATYIKANPDEINTDTLLSLSMHGGVKIFTDGVDWNASSSDDYIHIDIRNKDNDTALCFSVSKNEGAKRMGEIEVKSGDVSTTIRVIQNGICQKCNGEGIIDCPTCNGRGTVSYSNYEWIPYGYGGYWGWNSYAKDCSKCEQSGRVECYQCNGTGEDNY